MVACPCWSLNRRNGRPRARNSGCVLGGGSDLPRLCAPSCQALQKSYARKQSNGQIWRSEQLVENKCLNMVCDAKEDTCQLPYPRDEPRHVWLEMPPAYGCGRRRCGSPLPDAAAVRETPHRLLPLPCLGAVVERPVAGGVIRPKRISFPEHFCYCFFSNLCVLNATNTD
jgi:hypothetical protein